MDLAVVDLAKAPGFFPLRAWRLGERPPDWFLPGRFEVDDEARLGLASRLGLQTGQARLGAGQTVQRRSSVTLSGHPTR